MDLRLCVLNYIYLLSLVIDNLFMFVVNIIRLLIQVKCSLFFFISLNNVLRHTHTHFHTACVFSKIKIFPFFLLNVSILKKKKSKKMKIQMLGKFEWKIRGKKERKKTEKISFIIISVSFCFFSFFLWKIVSECDVGVFFFACCIYIFISNMSQK